MRYDLGRTLPTTIVTIATGVVAGFETKGNGATPFKISKLDHLVIRCKHFQETFDFYTNILGCTIDQPEDVGRFGGSLTHLRAGSALIDLLSYDESHLTDEGKETTMKFHSGGKGTDAKILSEVSSKVSSSHSTLDHVCLRVDPFDEGSIREFMEANNVPIVSSGQRKGAEGIGPSIYISDPEGNVVELKGPSVSPSSKKDSEFESINFADGRSTKNSDEQRVVSITTEQKVPPAEPTRSLADDSDTRTEGTWSENLPPSPCTRICRYNRSFYDGEVCIGCFRDVFEISNWTNGMTNIERSMALFDAADRADEAIQHDFEGSISKDELLRQAQQWYQKSQAKSQDEDLPRP